MKTITGIVVLSILALIGYRKSFVKITSNKKTGTYRFLTGTEFILIGILLGESFLGILDPHTLKNIHPILILGLGWIGLTAGIQLEWRALKALTGSIYFWTFFHACWLFMTVFFSTYGLLYLLFPTYSLLGIISAVLAIAAVSSAQTLLALWTRHLPKPKQALVRGLRLTTSILDVIVIISFGILIASFPAFATVASIQIPPWQKLLLSILIGVLLGMLFLLLFRTRLAEQDRILVTMGLILFGGGISYLLSISPLLVNLIAGMLLTNFSKRRDQAFRLLLKLEGPLYLTFLMIAGAYLKLETPLPVLLALGYCLLRGLCQATGSKVFLKHIFKDFAPRPKRPLGWGLLSQGGIAIALAVHFRLWASPRFNVPLLEITFAILLLGILINDLASPYGLAYSLEEEKQ